MSHIIDGIDIDSLLRARKTFEEFRKNMITDRDKAGAIQAFEFTYELAWKTMKRVLAKRGIEVGSPRDCIREAAINKLISDPEVWFSFLAIRNRASQTYEQENIDVVLQYFDVFSQAMHQLINNLNNSNLPFKVDLQSWDSLSPDFKALIEHDLTLV